MHRKSIEAASTLQDDNDHENGEDRPDLLHSQPSDLSPEQQQQQRQAQQQAQQQQQQQTDLQSGRSGSAAGIQEHLSSDQDDLRRDHRRDRRDDDEVFSRDHSSFSNMDKVCL